MNVQAMMQQAMQMQERLQKQMAEMRVEGQAGGGMVKAVVNGKGEVRRIRIECVEVATQQVVVRTLDKGGIDLAILDGEAHPAGGLGVCRQVKDEVYNAPPVIVLTGRPADAWLATWSRADGVVPQPIDPVVLAETAATLLRQRLAVTA